MQPFYRPSRVRAACALGAALSTLLIVSGIARLAEPGVSQAMAWETETAGQPAKVVQTI